MAIPPDPKMVYQPVNQTDDEIDLRQILAALLRHKNLIGIITGAAVILSVQVALTRKPVWEGQFQIVLEKQASGGLKSSRFNNPLLSTIAGHVDNQLGTEVKILESPLILRPTYDFVKAKKSESGEDVSNWTFLGWRENLDIKLESGSSVLSINYRDSDRALVIPVIEKIAKDYQRYSGRDRTRGLSQGVSYLKTQIAELVERSRQSMRKAQTYALTHGLGLQDGMPTQTSSSTSGTSVETNREATQNRVNALEQQLSSAKSAGNRSVFQAPQLVANTALFSKLQILESELLQKRALLQPNDDTIRRLTRRRKNLIAYINQQTIGLLEGELITAQSQLKSLSRPREVVLKHRELMRTAIRDENLLAELETQLQTVQLEQARQTDPWELISTPNLLDTSVIPRDPQKKRIITFGLLSGFVLGCAAALVRDHVSGLVYSEYELINTLTEPLLERLKKQEPNNWLLSCELLAKGPLKDLQSCALIPVGQPDNNLLKNLEESLQSAFAERRLILSNDLLETRDYDAQLLVVQPGKCSRNQLAKLKQSLALQGTPVAGWLLLDPTAETV